MVEKLQFSSTIMFSIHIIDILYRNHCIIEITAVEGKLPKESSSLELPTDLSHRWLHRYQYRVRGH